MSKTAAAIPAADDEPAGQSKIPMAVVVALLSINLLGTGVIAAKVMTMKVGGGGKEHHKEDKGEKLPGPVVALDTFVVNLNEPGSNRYLKTTFELEVADLAAQKEIEEQKRVVRDEVLSYLSNLTIKETMGEASKSKIKEDLTQRADKALGGHGKVKHLFFIEFVVQ